MPNRQLLTFIGIGIVIVAIALGITLYGTKGAHLSLTGTVLKVRTLGTDDKNSIAVVDFRVVNESKQNFVVQDATVTVTTADGKEVEGAPIARQDVNRVLDYYKILGPKYNETLIVRDKVGGGQKMDRMVAVAIPLPAEDLDKRKALKLQLHDVDGPTFDLHEKR
jgi:hypothetical protein